MIQRCIDIIIVSSLLTTLQKVFKNLNNRLFQLCIAANFVHAIRLVFFWCKSVEVMYCFVSLRALIKRGPFENHDFENFVKIFV